MEKIFNLLGISIVLLAFFLISCEKDEHNELYCNVSNPVEDLDWLKASIDEVRQDEYSFLLMAEYKSATIFYFGNCNPLINYMPVIMNCNGDTLGYTHNIFDELTEVKILWKHENSECTFGE